MKKSIFYVVNIIFVIFFIIGFSGCDFHKNNKNESGKIKKIILDAEQEKNANIKTEILKNRIIQVTINIPAQFKAVTTYLDNIYAPIDGKVMKVFVRPGDIVKIGQSLIEIKSDEIGQIQLNFLEEYLAMDSSVKQMIPQYNLAVQNYNRQNILFNEGISSRAEYEVALAQMLKDKASLSELKIQRNSLVKVYAQRVALYGGNESTIMHTVATKRIYPYITLRASKNGVVLSRKVNPGEIIDKDKELFNVADLSTIWLVGYAFEKDAPLLRVGQNVVGKLEESRGKTVKGKLSYVASILNTDTKTLEVHADIPNKDLGLQPNMYAEMRVGVGSVDALAAPNSALQKYGDYTFAYVKIKPNTYEERKVEIGQYNDKYTEIKSGLKIGEEVVSNGGFSILGESIKNSEE